jgi:hypothetical protein
MKIKRGWLVAAGAATTVLAVGVLAAATYVPADESEDGPVAANEPGSASTAKNPGTSNDWYRGGYGRGYGWDRGYYGPGYRSGYWGGPGYWGPGYWGPGYRGRHWW